MELSDLLPMASYVVDHAETGVTIGLTAFYTYLAVYYTRDIMHLSDTRKRTYSSLSERIHDTKQQQ